MWVTAATLRNLGVKRDELLAKIKAGKEKLLPEELEAVRLGHAANGALPRHALPLGLARPLRPPRPLHLLLATYHLLPTTHFLTHTLTLTLTRVRACNYLQLLLATNPTQAALI